MSANRRSWACTADASVNFGLGFIPGYNAVKAGASLIGLSFHPVEWATGTSGVVTTGPTPPQAAAGVASAGQLWQLAKYEAAGGSGELNRLADLTGRASFGLKSAASQAAMAGKLAGLSKLAKAVSSFGTVANLLNVASAAYDVYQCWHPQ
jgi:hypothetical protein